MEVLAEDRLRPLLTGPSSEIPSKQLQTNSTVFQGSTSLSMQLNVQTVVEQSPKVIGQRQKARHRGGQHKTGCF